MTQSSNRLFDEMSRLMGDAASVAQGVKREAETAFRSQMERFVGNMDLVKREEFEVVREMASQARQENEALKQRIADLEAALAKRPPGCHAPGFLPCEAGEGDHAKHGGGGRRSAL
jgi:BMFP domain-containing protein YqiC